VLLEHGELVAGDDAPDLLREARDLFAGLAAAPWLERAERALAPAVA